MRTRDIKTIDVNAKEWFDKVNGNSYFSANVVINYGMKNQESYSIPMQYGYGDHYRHVAFDVLRKEAKVFKAMDGNAGYWNAYEKYNIIARHNKKENCLKREL
jgi:hypothetical protein